MPPHPDQPLLFLDYDGTLAPIVDDPAAAWPHPDVPDLLLRLAAVHPVVVVTGRDLVALGRLLCHADGAAVDVRAIGLHGAEWGRPGVADEHQAVGLHAEALAALRACIPMLGGMEVEDKGGTFAVHYRRAAERETARAALARWADDVPAGLEAVWGKCVVELRPAGVSKGAAVSRVAAEHPARTPVYLGDDVTDEDAFRALATRADAVTVKVGDGETLAQHRLPDVEAVVEYLRGFLPGAA